MDISSTGRERRRFPTVIVTNAVSVDSRILLDMRESSGL